MPSASTIKNENHPDNTPIKQLHRRPKILDNIIKMSPRITKRQLLQMSVQEQKRKFNLDYNEVVQIRRILLGLADMKPEEKTVEVVVPNVIGMSLNDASNTIRKAQLSIGQKTYQDDVTPKDTVINQDPNARTKVQVYSDFYLVLSSGINVLIPDITGKKLEYALRILRENGLKSEPVIHLSSSEQQPRNTVLKVIPSAGKRIVPNTEITLEVSSGQVKQRAPNKII